MLLIGSLVHQHGESSAHQPQLVYVRRDLRTLEVSPPNFNTSNHPRQGDNCCRIDLQQPKRQAQS